MSDETPAIPILDIRALVAGADDRGVVAARIGEACRSSGFFYVVGHGVDEALQDRLERLSQRFFALDGETKLRIRMALGGSAWRGYFPVGGELTSGLPDRKEGIYFGAELDDDHPLVRAGTPLHGQDLFPAEIPELRETVLAYLEALTRLGHTTTMACSRSSSRTTPAASRSRRGAAGSRRRRSRDRSCATSGTCSIG